MSALIPSPWYPEPDVVQLNHLSQEGVIQPGEGHSEWHLFSQLGKSYSRDGMQYATRVVRLEWPLWPIRVQSI